MVKLRSFDAFPKLEESYIARQQQTRPMTYLFMFMSVFFLYLETSMWMGTAPKQQFDVDRDISDKLQVNLQILVYNRCDDIGIYIQDESDDRLFVNELVQAVRYTPYPDSDEQWCELGGIFDTNRVRGQLVIVPKNPSLAMYGNRPQFNTSHYISELSFGEYYPNMINPLDQTAKVFNEPTAQAYFLSIIPTTYKAFGISLETNQYTVTEATKATDGNQIVPSIFFKYDFDPIKVTVSDSRMSFFAWLCRAMNILGGIIFATKAISRMWKPKRGTRSDRTATGILDVPKA